MGKPDALKGQVKHDARAGDRHNPTMPNHNAWVWARELTTNRVADLFSTLGGLPGHWEQLQNAINAGNNHFYAVTQHGGGYSDGGKTSEEGKKLITFISEAVIAAARNAKFDFPLHTLKFTNDMAWLKISRANGGVHTTSKP